MAYILQLETSTDVCSVAISASGSTISIVESLEPNSHTEKLTLLIIECLAKVEISIKNLHAICISDGPGSFTSLRVGSSVAKGICYSLKIPLIAIDSLFILAHGIDNPTTLPEDYIIPMIDARRMEVYTAFFKGNLTQITSTQSLIIEQDILHIYKGEKSTIHLCGNGAIKYFEKHYSDNVRLFHTRTSADYMSKTAFEYYENKQFQDLAYYTPNYLKSPNITKSSKNLIL